MGKFNRLGNEYEITLTRDSKMLMRVNLTIPPPPDSKHDTVFRAGGMEISKGYYKWGAVECYLTKVSD